MNQENDLKCLVPGYEGTYFKIGQIWETRNGNNVKVVNFYHNNNDYKVVVIEENNSDELTYTQRGSYYNDEENRRDLVKLGSDVDEFEICEENKTEDTKQEFQTITLNGIPYHLVPTDISDEFKDMIKKANKVDLVEEVYEKTLRRQFEDSNGKYVVIFKEKKSDNWSFCYRPTDLSWRKDWDYKLIKKEHKEILEAYLKDRSIKIECKICSLWTLLKEDKDFIEYYDEDNEYRLVKKEFEPFELKIQVNTIDDLKSLWNRFVTSNNEIYKIRGAFYKVKEQESNNFFETWNYLDDILEEFEETPDMKKELDDK